MRARRTDRRGVQIERGSPDCSAGRTRIGHRVARHCAPSLDRLALLTSNLLKVLGRYGAALCYWTQPASDVQHHARSSDPLHAIYGMPWRTPLLRAFAAGQGQSTTARWAPLLSLAVPCSMPHTCPKDASGS